MHMIQHEVENIAMILLLFSSMLLILLEAPVIDESLMLMPKDYFHASFFARSLSESDSLDPAYLVISYRHSLGLIPYSMSIIAAVMSVSLPYLYHNA